VIGLTSLKSSPLRKRRPRLDRERARFVLQRIDAILAWEEEVSRQREIKYAELGRYLCEVRDREHWRLEPGCDSFEAYLQKKFPDSRRKAYYLMSIHDNLRPYLKQTEIDHLGWTKAAQLAKVARSEGKRFNCAPWLHKARELPREEFKREVERHFTGKEPEPTQIISFRLTESQLEVVERALNTAMLMIGSEKSRSHALELICADFLAGASVGSDPELLYFSLQRLFRFLPPDDQHRFLAHAQERRQVAAAQTA